MGTLNLREWTMQEWTYRHDVERVDSAGVGNLRYVLRQWVNTSSIGPARLTVRDNAARTYNTVLESFHASLRRRMKVAHPNLYAFLGHLQPVTLDNQADITRLDRGLRIRRRKTRGVSWTIRASKPASIAMTAARIHRCSSWTP